jgi:hypothetical protein
MKEFNLEEAKEGKPVCTRDGRDVTIIGYIEEKDHKTIEVHINGTPDTMIFYYHLDGRFKCLDRNHTHHDLIMK